MRSAGTRLIDLTTPTVESWLSFHNVFIVLFPGIVKGKVFKKDSILREPAW